MAKSLLFIPDISGFTNFVQTTEAEHSQHVIAELLEVLLAANTQQLQLAEIEGDALFFFKEDQILSQEQLLAQFETMFTAFYSHLKLLKENRICPCRACSSAVDLELKIVAHSGTLQFLEVQNNRKPFGEAVIQAHRLLKNSIDSDNYVLVSKDLASEIKMPTDYESSLFQFRESVNRYDDKDVHYLFSEISVDNLRLKPHQAGHTIAIDREPNLIFERTYPVDAARLLERITNYKYRHLWTAGADEIQFNENEVTRAGSSHICVIGDQHLDFKVKTKINEHGDLVYGEETTSPPPVDRLFSFYNITSLSEEESKLKLEVYWEAKSPFKKLLLALVVKRVLRKNIIKSLDMLRGIL